MRELATVLQFITHEAFTYNHAKRAMHDMFRGTYKDFLKALKRKREDGASFQEAAAGLVAAWQHRMMPNV
jgi:hypothetical protein